MEPSLLGVDASSEVDFVSGLPITSLALHPSTLGSSASISRSDSGGSPLSFDASEETENLVPSVVRQLYTPAVEPAEQQM